MPKINNNTKVINGMVYGTIKIGQTEVDFEITSLDYWLSLDNQQAEKIAKEAMWESGLIDWWF